jgi:hypothetical protein
MFFYEQNGPAKTVWGPEIRDDFSRWRQSTAEMSSANVARHFIGAGLPDFS